MGKDPHDLSSRANGITNQRQKAGLPPIFSRRNASPNGTLTFLGSSTLDFFVAPGTATVLWIQIQLGSNGAVQLFKSGEPISAAYTLNAGAIVRFSGMLLSGNEKLSLFCSTANSIPWELAWVKETEERFIETVTFISNPASSSGGVTSINLLQQAGVVLSAPIADAPAGTETAPVVRDIARKKQTLLTTTPLAANGVFTSPWFDTELTGGNYVTVVSVSNVPALATNGIRLQESEDQIVANLFDVAFSGANNTIRLTGVIRQRYWRVVYTNGATIQASFSLYATETPFPFGTTQLVNGGISEYQIIATGTGGAGVAADALANQLLSLITNQSGVGGTQQNVGLKFNGSTWDRPRNNVNTTTGDTGAKTVTFNGATQTNFEGLGAFITILLGAVTGTTPTLSLQLQHSPDGGTTWLNLGPALANLISSSQTGLIAIFPTNFSQTAGATPANLTSGASVSMFLNSILPRTWRLVYTISGTTPSFTINSVNVNYMKA